MSNDPESSFTHEAALNEYLSALIEQGAQEDQKKRQVHALLSEEDRRINEAITIRVAGCNDQGEEAGKEAVLRDAQTIAALYLPQVVSPTRILEQVRKMSAMVRNVGGNLLQLDPRDFEFMNSGGHIPHRKLPNILPEVCAGTKRKMYALLAEYVTEKEGHKSRVPLAYHFGFTEMPPPDDRDFKSLNASSLSGKSAAYAKDHYEEIFAPWRVGVVESIDEDFERRMSKLDIDIPQELKGKTARRRGLNTLFKIVYATAAKELKKRYIIYNTALLHPHKQEIAFGIPNFAQQQSNKDLFLPLGKRTHWDTVRTKHDTIVADVEWDTYGNTPESVLEAAMSEGGVLQAKGGFNFDRFKEIGRILAAVIRRRQIGGGKKNGLEKK